MRFNSPKIKTSKVITIFLVWLIVIGYLLFVIIPYGWLFITSLKESSEVIRLPLEFLPDKLYLKNYFEVLAINNLNNSKALSINISSAFINTLIVAFISTFIALLIGLPASYSFAKYKFWGRKSLLITTLTTRMFPVIALAIPIFQIILKIGLYDNKIGLILVYTSLTLPFTIWVMYSYFRDVPTELEDAAKIDGCNFFKMFIHVILPISKPGIIATFILTLIYPWNELLLNSILSASKKSQTLAYALVQYNTGQQIYWGHLSAAVIATSLPVVILTLLLQRYVIQGLTLGAVKE